MLFRRHYKPTETHKILYPEPELIRCACGTSFAPREAVIEGEDDPELCLTCNRKNWSKLHGYEPSPVKVGKRRTIPSTAAPAVAVFRKKESA